MQIEVDTSYQAGRLKEIVLKLAQNVMKTGGLPQPPFSFQNLLCSSELQAWD